MSSRNVRAASSVGLAAARSSSSASAPGSAGPPATITARSHGHSARAASTRAAALCSTIATRARLSLSRNAYSAGVTSGFTGTATAPSLAVPQKAAAKAGVSSRARSTRCSMSTPSAASALPQRSTASATSA